MKTPLPVMGSGAFCVLWLPQQAHSHEAIGTGTVAGWPNICCERTVGTRAIRQLPSAVCISLSFLLQV